ncbi:hypothetical protein D3C75_1341770 [compost metagenome]
MPLDVGTEAKAVHGQWRYHLDGGLADRAAYPFDFHFGLATLHIQQLEQLRVLVRLDFPVMQTAACRDRLAVQ